MGEFLEGTHLGRISCEGGQNLFCNLDQGTKTTLLQRLCLSSMTFMGHYEAICQKHIGFLLGSPFEREANRNCFWPDHLEKRGVSDKRQLRFLTLEVSMFLRAHAQIYVPFRTGLCLNCSKYSFKPIMDKLILEGFPPVLQDNSNMNLHFPLTQVEEAEPLETNYLICPLVKKTMLMMTLITIYP